MTRWESSHFLLVSPTTTKISTAEVEKSEQGKHGTTKLKRAGGTNEWRQMYCVAPYGKNEIFWREALCIHGDLCDTFYVNIQHSSRVVKHMKWGCQHARKKKEIAGGGVGAEERDKRPTNNVRCTVVILRLFGRFAKK